jgi:hypothetical protein
MNDELKATSLSVHRSALRTSEFTARQAFDNFSTEAVEKPVDFSPFGVTSF